MNLLLFIDAVAVSFYIASCMVLIKDITRNQYKRLALILAWLGSGAHLSSIALSTWHKHALDFSFFTIASFVSLIIVLFLLLACFSKPVEKLGIVLLPIAALMLSLNEALPNNTPIQTHHSMEMIVHILSSLTAFSLLAIAAVQAILLALQNAQLKSHSPGRLILALPPLQAMESLLFQMISTGLLFLSIALLTGFFFIEDFFAQHLAHKTVFSMIAWLIFSALLIGRRRYGWRGKTAIRWTLYGFMSLFLGYFGSKLVLELILNKV